MEHWIVYDLATGEPRYRGSGPTGSARSQLLPDGLALVLVPQAVVVGADLDFAALRAGMAANVDEQAEQVRQQFLTPGAGQAMTYTRKEAEARAWTAESSIPTPFLSAEAAARGMTVADLAAEVIQFADAWTLIGSAIEGRRMGAKAAIGTAGNLGAIVAAGTVDWSTIGAPGA